EGGRALRQTIASTYERIEPEDVLCFAGAQEGLWCLMHALLGAGDHAIVTVPNYQSMESIPLSLCDVSGIALRENAGWTVDIEALRTKLRAQTKLIATNFPNNPTGAVATRAGFDALIAVAAERDIHFLSDEVYRGLERDDARRLPQAADLYERAISLGVMSKAYGLPGLRVGWIACRDRELLARMARLKHYLSICNAAPSELLARIALKARDRLLTRNRAIVAENLDLLDAFFARHTDVFEWRHPDGGCVAFPRYLGADGVDAFCTRLVEEHGILLLPAGIYHSELVPVPTDRFRIGFGRSGMAPALDAFENALEMRTGRTR
ncbi:MAG: aminotransferase class I/II-fold pyridoxal phosphate-dependent enzyme, partial [Vulcanimicrobiaceae bacterium]